MLFERDRIRGEVDEQVAVPLGDVRGDERPIFFAEAVDLLHVRRFAERTVELVRPAVVLALDAAVKLALLFGAEQRSAMAADVVVGAYFSVLVADDDDAGIRKLAGDEAARA